MNEKIVLKNFNSDVMEVVAVIKVTESKKTVIDYYLKVGDYYPVIKFINDNRYSLISRKLSATDTILGERSLERNLDEVENYVGFEILKPTEYSCNRNTVTIGSGFIVDLI